VIVAALEARPPGADTAYVSSASLAKCRAAVHGGVSRRNAEVHRGVKGQHIRFAILRGTRPAREVLQRIAWEQRLRRLG
jgi:hypothetical protein